MILGITASSRVAAAATVPVFRSVATASTTTSSMTCAMPTGFTAGDILIMQVNVNADGKTGGSTYGWYNPPPGWTTKYAQDDFGGDYRQMDIFTKIATGSETSLTWPILNNYAAAMSIIAISGGTAIDVVGAAGVGSLVAGSITTTTSSDLLVGCWWNWCSTSDILVKPTSMTQRSNMNIYSPITDRYINTLITTENLIASGATGNRTATTSGTSAYPASTLLAVK
jgi:hypothetical protein